MPTTSRSFDVAQTHFERALQLDPTSVSTLNNYGWSLIEQGRLREAKPFLELALRHAEPGDVPLVAGNIESIRRARPSALVAALESGPGANQDPQRLIRVDDNTYRLETIAAPAGRSERAPAAHDAPSPGGSLRQHDPVMVSPAGRRPRPDAKPAGTVVTEGVGGAGFAPASAGHFRAAEPERDIPVDPPSGRRSHPTLAGAGIQARGWPILGGD